jgi:hypothetical protein
MIDRILVPKDAHLSAAADTTTQRRRPTTMDERTLVPAMLPVVPLDGHSTIPSNLPLESIATRVVVPRDVNREAYNVKEDHSTPLQPTDMDSRITVPQGAAPPETIEPFQSLPTDLVDPDIFMTGEVQLIAPPQKEDQWQTVTRISSIAFHILLLLVIIFQSKLFPPHGPTQEQMELARRQMTVLLPPGALEALKPTTRPGPPPPRVHVDPRVLREVAPPIIPAPAPPPERPVKELPSAPVPKQNAVQPVPAPQTDAPTAKAPLKLELPDMPQAQHPLVLPRETSPSQSIQNSVRGLARSSGPRPIVGGGRIPGGASGRGGGGGNGTAYGGLQMLTPDEGVDFSGYLQRVHDAIERNWFAVMPASVSLGEQGKVVLTFRIMRDGSVPSDSPVINLNSGKEPLDRAAFSSIRASNPFERLPPQFSGPYIELRCIYLYNLPLENIY